MPFCSVCRRETSITHTFEHIYAYWSKTREAAYGGPPRPLRGRTSPPTRRGRFDLDRSGSAIILVLEVMMCGGGDGKYHRLHMHQGDADFASCCDNSLRGGRSTARLYHDCVGFVGINAGQGGGGGG